MFGALSAARDVALDAVLSLEPLESSVADGAGNPGVSLFALGALVRQVAGVVGAVWHALRHAVGVVRVACLAGAAGVARGEAVAQGADVGYRAASSAELHVAVRFAGVSGSCWVVVARLAAVAGAFVESWLAQSGRADIWSGASTCALCWAVDNARGGSTWLAVAR